MAANAAHAGSLSCAFLIVIGIPSFPGGLTWFHRKAYSGVWKPDDI
jgi:hypothetical protein